MPSPPPHEPHAGSAALPAACLPSLCCGSSPARVLGNKQPGVFTTAREWWGLPLAVQTCPALHASRCSLSNAGSPTEQWLGLKGRAGSEGVALVSPSAPGTPNGVVGVVRGRGSCQPHLQASPSSSTAPHHPCGDVGGVAPMVPQCVGMVGGCGRAGRVSSHLLSPASLPPWLQCQPVISP